MDPAYPENKRVPLPGLTQGSTYVYPDYYRRLSATIMSGDINPDDTEAIRQQYYDHHSTQPPLPMEALQADTPRDVYVGGFTYYEAPAPMDNFNETYRQLLATPGQNQWHPYALNDGPPDAAVDAMTRNAQLYWDTGGYQNFDSQPLQDLPERVYIEVDDVPPNSTYASTQATP
jgi:hypothetical protein